MDSSLVAIVLLALSVAVSFNLFLTFRLVFLVNANKLRPPFSVMVGEPIVGFHGRMFFDGRPVTSGDLIGQAAVLVFLSAGCKKCHARIPELKELIHPMRRLGIPLWIIGVDSARGVARHLKGSELLPSLVVLDLPTRRSLNPGQASPFYIFIDHRGTAKASNFVGDENWQLFVGQMHGDQPDASTGQ